MKIKQWLWNNRLLSERQRIEWYPPFWLMRIKVLHLSPDWRNIDIMLPHSWLATNTSGSLFGGFQACLADPIAAMACVKLFPQYSIWTRALQIEFIYPGLSDLELRFSMSAAQEQAIRQELARKGRSTPNFSYGFFQTDGSQCTKISAAIAIRPKGYKRSSRPLKSSLKC